MKCLGERTLVAQTSGESNLWDSQAKSKKKKKCFNHLSDCLATKQPKQKCKHLFIVEDCSFQIIPKMADNKPPKSPTVVFKGCVLDLNLGLWNHSWLT